MKTTFLFLLILFTVSFSYAQNLVGKWAGYYKYDGGKNQNPFTIEFLENKGKLVAFTRSEFKVENQQFYSVCSARVKVIKDNFAIKIIVTEYKFHTGNTPKLARGCFQEHTLLFTSKDNTDFLSGFWKTANKINNCGSGSTLLERDSESKTVPQATINQN